MRKGKRAALDVLAKASDVFGCWQILDEAVASGDHDAFTRGYIDGEREMLADEIADCIQACCNLADRYDIDLQAAMSRCEERNRERGRYK